jgi:hypothetical protein
MLEIVCDYDSKIKLKLKSTISTWAHKCNYSLCHILNSNIFFVKYTLFILFSKPCLLENVSHEPKMDLELF